MNRLNQVLLILHFVGLTMGLAASYANATMGALIAKAAPPERPVLGRFPPRMSVIGRIGLGLLWVTGLSLVYVKYGGFAALPWTIHLKLSMVVLLTVTVGYIWSLERRVHRGDMAAAARIPVAGMFATLFALLSIIFAVVTFN